MSRRLTVNPDPLRVVKAGPRAGSAAGDLSYLLCRRTREGDLVAASIHRDGCRAAPDDQALLADGSVWHVARIALAEVNPAFAECCDRGVEPKVSCRSCGGWWRS